MGNRTQQAYSKALAAFDSLEEFFDGTMEIGERTRHQSEVEHSIENTAESQAVLKRVEALFTEAREALQGIAKAVTVESPDEAVVN